MGAIAVKTSSAGNGGRDTFILAGGQADSSRRLADADVIVDFNGDRIGLTDGNAFASLTFEAVSLTLNGGSAVSATAIKLGTNYLGIVRGGMLKASLRQMFL